MHQKSEKFDILECLEVYKRLYDLNAAVLNKKEVINNRHPLQDSSTHLAY